jgi:hypothetical protein
MLPEERFDALLELRARRKLALLDKGEALGLDREESSHCEEGEAEPTAERRYPLREGFSQGFGVVSEKSDDGRKVTVGWAALPQLPGAEGPFGHPEEGSSLDLGEFAGEALVPEVFA